MKRFQINENELYYLVEMLEYLKGNEEPLSFEANQQLKEVIVKIQSRPVLDIVIDPKVLEEAQEKFNEEHEDVK